MQNEITVLIPKWLRVGGGGREGGGIQNEITVPEWQMCA
jgi:hypothetical protein